MERSCSGSPIPPCWRPGRVPAGGQLHAELNPVVEEFHRLRKLLRELDDARRLQQETIDPEMRELAAAELQELDQRRGGLESSLELSSCPGPRRRAKHHPGDPGGGRGRGGGAVCRRTVPDVHPIRRVAALARGDARRKRHRDRGNPRGHLHRGGPQRIQPPQVRERRPPGAAVPATEASGRIHTSTVTVAVLPERRRWTSRSTRTICASMSSAPPARAAKRQHHGLGRADHPCPRAGVTCQDEKSNTRIKGQGVEGPAGPPLRSGAHPAESGHRSGRRTQSAAGERAERSGPTTFPEPGDGYRIGLTIHNLSAVLEGDLERLDPGAGDPRPDRRLKALS